ncbi:MAG: tetratricopeptide repeat protein [Gemmatimonadaceae bacterium]|nr:tetratricopeptide repeat protein [Gemmatimonadaceae bacterium]
MSASVRYRSSLGIAALVTVAVVPAAQREGISAQTLARRSDARMAVVAPVGEPRDLLHRADSIARLGRYDDALVLIRQYRSLAPDSVQGVVALARTLAWAERFSESVDAYASAATLRPDDYEIRLAHATALGWAKRYDDAARVFRSMESAPHAAARAAARGLATVAGWRGERADALRRWESLVASDARDAESWVGLSHARRWSGDTRGALRAADSAIALDGSNHDAVAAQRAAQAVIGPSTEPQYLQVHDSDGNRSQFGTVSARVATPWPGSLLVSASQREAEYLAARGTAQTVRAVTTWSAGEGGGLALRAEVGATRLDGRRAATDTSSTRTSPTLALGASFSLSPQLTLGATVSRRPFDEVALLIVQGISTTAFDAHAEYNLAANVAVLAELGVMQFHGGAANVRQHGALTIRHAPLRWASLGAVLKHQGNNGTPHDGYFAPKQYQLAEVVARIGRDVPTGFMGAVELGLGAQQIHVAATPVIRQATRRVSASLTWRPSPAAEVTALSDAGRMASPFTQVTGAYDYVTVGLRVRMPLHK